MASDSALFVGWKVPVVGREADAVELFNSFVGYLGKQEAAGAIESFARQMQRYTKNIRR